MTDEQRAELKRLAGAADSFAKHHDERARFGGYGWEFHARVATHIRVTGTAVLDLLGTLATEEAERIRCRDGWAAASAENERLKHEVRRLRGELNGEEDT